MKKRSFIKSIVFFGSIIFIAIPSVSYSDPIEMGIVTGGTDGTYIQIGKDIADLVKSHGINLSVYPSNGSLDNIADVYERKGVQLGIVQSDVLSSLKEGGNTNKDLARIAQKVKMVFPLYNEEVHILGNKSVNTFSDLEGKTVAIGKEGSGTYLTASLILEVSSVSPSQQLTAGGKDALDMLLNNEIDAMFYVSGYPVKLFTDLSHEKINLVSIRDKNIIEFYTPSIIPAGVYPFLKNDLETVAVKAVLMSYDYKRANCENVGKLAKIIYDEFSSLKENGHSKWQDVDLDFNLKKWDQYSCVKTKLAKSNMKSSNSDTKSLLRNTLKSMGN